MVYLGDVPNDWKFLISVGERSPGWLSWSLSLKMDSSAISVSFLVGFIVLLMCLGGRDGARDRSE